ncbi:MAG TPA: hypothetical protein DCX21_05840 [Eubacterium sp.]|nr:hypothetical protein [Eubacterium sp.]HBZ52770.1 hypothetical protein [Eubacterium sp.]
MANIKPVIFRIEDQIYGIDINAVQGIELYNEIIPVPNAVSCVDGLINIRGDIIPVYNLRKKEHKETGPDFNIKEEQFIIVLCHGERLALMVDVVEDIRDIKDESYQELPIICTNKNNDYVTGIAHLDVGLAVIIDAEKLLSNQEIDVLNKVVKDK